MGRKGGFKKERMEADRKRKKETLFFEVNSAKTSSAIELVGLEGGEAGPTTEMLLAGIAFSFVFVFPFALSPPGPPLGVLSLLISRLVAFVRLNLE